MAISTFKRYEKKYLITRLQLDGLLPLLSEYMELDSHCIGGAKYTIYNIYYDDENSSIIRDNTIATAYKEKIRLRSYYVVSAPDDKVFMELKKKENGVGNKRRIQLKLSEVDDLLYNGKAPETHDYLSGQVAKELQYYLSVNHVVPAVYLQYDRLAFFGKEDPEFRITIDDNIRARRNDFSFGPDENDEQLLEPDTYIMEVKFLGSMPMWLAAVLSSEGIFSRGFSKYGTEYKRRIAQRKLPYHLKDKDGNDKILFEFK